ncbi:MAG: hypothetical protein QOH11_2968 [Solirubrobacteraceae bacterium]|nr:hypothetical protein [Solirubrobacteraceae bacterium]
MPRIRLDPTTLLLAAAVLLAALLLLHRSHPASRFRADPTLTPGALNPAVTPTTLATTVCVRGWTATIRPPTEYTNHLKVVQLRQYGFPGSTADYQEDHFISLGLGGHPTDPHNFWPEPWPRARAVDTIERDLHDKLCHGQLSLEEVQHRIAALKYADG